MRPIKLVMTAFGAYGKRVELDFGELKNRKFFLITGPTGSGKTTILDAMCFALYGEPSGDRDSRSVRSDHVGTELMTEVEFTFAIGSSIYRIRRVPEQVRAKKRGGGTTMQAAEAELWELNGEAETLLGSNVGQVTKKAEELLGFKSTQFRQVVLLPQGEFKKLLTADSLEREKIMQTLFQTEQYAALERYLKEKAKQVSSDNESKAKEKEFLLKEESVETIAELEQVHKAAQLEQAAQEQQLKVIEQQRSQSRQALEAGRQNEQRLKEQQTAKLAVQEMQGKIELVNSYREKFTLAERAGQLDDIYSQLTDRISVNTKQVQMQQTAEKALIAAKNNKANCQLVYQQEAEQSEARQQLALECNKLREWLPKVTELAKEQALCEAAQSRLQAGRSRLAELTVKLNTEKSSLDKLQSSLLAAAETAAGVKGFQLELDSLTAALQKINEYNEQQKKLAQSEQVISQSAAVLQELSAVAVEKNQLAEKLHRLFISGQAAILAAQLDDSIPCPVCGSLEHPKLAQAAADIPSEQEIKTLQMAAKQALEKQQQQQQALAVKQEAFKAAQGLAEHLLQEAHSLAEFASLEELAMRQKTVQEAKIKAEQAMQTKADLEKQLISWQKLLADSEREINQNESAVKAAEEKYNQLKAVVAAKVAEIPAEYQSHDKLSHLVETKELELKIAEQRWNKVQLDNQQAAVALATAEETLKQAQVQAKDSQSAYQQASELWQSRLQASGFSDEQAYKANRKTPEYIANLKERIELFDKNLQSAKDRAERADKAAEGIKQVDINSLVVAAQAAEESYTKALRILSELAAGNKKRAAKLARLAKLDEEMNKINEQYGIIGYLADIANGKNDAGVTFQRYVLGNLLDEVADSASVRLRIMSRNRYQLRRTAEKRRKNAQSGLELEVFDDYTGIARSVGTLSGGESFLASLALSLGLADVVQNYAGGIRLDTILVDEGFGTLDPEALEMALKTLVNLQDGGRLVGIISHVPELKERIDARLEVTATKTGSTAKFVVG